MNAFESYIETLSLESGIERDRFELRPGITQPERLPEMYALFDGQEESGFQLFSNFRFLPEAEALELSDIMAEFAVPFTEKELSEGPVKKNQAWRDGWTIFGVMPATNNFLVVDNDPGREGTVGQVIIAQVNDDSKPVLGRTIEAFFEFALKHYRMNGFEVCAINKNEFSPSISSRFYS